MKTPEEIKSGLECCANGAMECFQKCPYAYELEFSKCVEFITRDALALIQQLEAQARQLCEENDNLRLNFAKQSTELATFKLECLKEVKKVIDSIYKSKEG